MSTCISAGVGDLSCFPRPIYSNCTQESLFLHLNISLLEHERHCAVTVHFLFSGVYKSRHTIVCHMTKKAGILHYAYIDCKKENMILMHLVSWSLFQSTTVAF